MAILVDGRILAKIQIPELTIFHDTTATRQALIASSFDSKHGSGLIRNVKFYTAKEL